MTNPEQKTAETQSRVRVNTSIVLYESDVATLGLVLRPVKRIIDRQKAASQAEALTGSAADLNAASQPASPPPEGSQSQPPAPTPTPSLDLQKKTDQAFSTLYGNMRAILVTQSSIESKDNKSQDEYGPLIKMPLPEKIKDSLRLNYSTADLGFAAAGAMFGEQVANSFKQGPGVAEAVAGNASYAIRTLLTGLGSSISGTTQKLAGNIPNPFSATIFEKVAPRKFNFSWTIQPQSPKESENLRDVINHLRYWSLPNPSADRLMLDVPYEWEISFVGSNFLYSFSRCVMSSIDIDYSPNGFNSFMSLGADAAPQSVTITIDFEEIYPLDKSTLDDSNTPSSMKPSGDTAPRAQNAGLEEAAKREEGVAQLNVVAGAGKKRDEAGETYAKDYEKFANAWAAGSSIGAPENLQQAKEYLERYEQDPENWPVSSQMRGTYNSAVSSQTNLVNAEATLLLEKAKYARITGETIGAPATNP